MAKRGATVVGVDISQKLLQIAELEEAAKPLGIEYLNDDACELSKLPDNDFDGVICNWSLLDIPDLNACLAAVARVLRSNGWFVFSMTHPCFMTRDFDWKTEASQLTVDRLVANYLREGYSPPGISGGIRGKVGRHYRTLGTYLNGLMDSGLVLDRVIEFQEEADHTGDIPIAGSRPPSMVVACRKP